MFDTSQTLLLECRQCSMKFDSKDQLANHLSKFCTKSDYGDVKKLQQKLDEANKESDGHKLDLRNNLSVDEIKQYLRGEDVSYGAEINDLPLGKIRQNIRAVESEFELATKEQMARREQEMRQELNTLRLEKQQIRAKRKQEEAVLEDLLRELEKRKEREFKARAEKEQIEMARKELENRKLTALETEKKQELKKLAEEREAVRLKEEELMNEIEKLGKRINDNERLWKAERDKINLEAQGVDVSINMQNLHKRQMQLAKERGEFAANLIKKNDILEQEKVRIMDDLRKIKKGDYGSIRKNAAGVMIASKILNNPTNSFNEERRLPSQAQRMKEKLNEGYEHLNQLKRQHEQTLGRDDPDIESIKETYRPEITSLTPVMSNQNFRAPPPISNQKNRFLSELENIRKQSAPHYAPREATPKLENNFNAYNNPYAPGNQFNPTNPYMPNNSPSQPNLYMPNNSPSQPNPYIPNGPNTQINPYMPPNQFMQPNPFMPPNPYNPYGFNPYAIQPPFGYNLPFPPFSPYPQNPAEDPEAKMLMEKIKKMKRKLKEPQNDEFFNTLQEGLRGIQNKINNIDPKPSENIQNSNNTEILPEERALRNVMQQEQSELRLLAALPPDSDLYNAKLEHYKEMAQIRMRMEAMLQELALNRMKKNFERDMELEDRKYQNEKWIEDQKKAIISNRIPELSQENRYENSFYIYFDFVTGIPTKYNFCQLVYGLYDHGEEKLEPKLVDKVSLELDSYKSPTSRAIFASEHDIKNLASSPSVNLVVEVQAVIQNKTIQFGWSLIEMFTSRNQLNEGLWKLPVYKAPTDVNMELKDIRKLTPIANSYIFGRVGGPNSKVLQVTVNPDNTSVYNIPLSHTNLSAVPGSRNVNEAGSFVIPRSRNAGINTLANNGISIRIEKLLGFISKSHLKFQITIQQDSRVALDQQGNPCKWVSEPVNALGLEMNTGKTRRIPGTHIRAEKAELRASDIDSNAKQSSGYRNTTSEGHNVIDVNKEVSFINNFYSELHRNNWTKNLYLIIEVLEKTAQSFSNADLNGEREPDITKYFPVAWTVIELGNTDQRILNFGTVELNLYEHPVIVPVTDPETLRLKQGTLGITIYEPTGARSSGPPASVRPGSLSMLKPPSRSPAFLENLTPQIEDARYYEKGDGIDFYIDGARFLPDNTTCTKVLIKAYTANLEKVGNSVGGLPELDSFAYSPVFGFRTEFRKPIFDPTTMINVTILTIDKNHNEERVLGYVAINMFVNKMRTDQPSNPNDQDFIVNKGNFQMPIYCQEPYRKPPFNVGSFKKLEAIPCATLLIRIREAPKADNGLRVLSMKDVLQSEWYIRGIVIPPPKYEERSYNTSNCMPSNIERLLYEERLQRKDVTVRDATFQIQNQLGIRLDLSDEELHKWIDQRLQVTPRTPMIDMKYFAIYNPKLGFKVAIDAIHNTPTEDPYVLIFCLNPPGALYSSTVITEDVQFTTKVEWSSSIKTPQYLDGFHTYKNILFDKNLHLIIDIRAVSFAKQRPEVMSIGWTLLPIFSNDGYVRSGIYQLPVFKGNVPASFLTELAVNDPWALLMNSVSKPGGPVYLDPVSVIVRLVDTQRDGHFIVPLDVNRISYEYITEDIKPKLAYNAAAQAKSEQQRKLKSLVPPNFSPEAYLKKVNEAVANVILILARRFIARSGVIAHWLLMITFEIQQSDKTRKKSSIIIMIFITAFITISYINYANL